MVIDTFIYVVEWFVVLSNLLDCCDNLKLFWIQLIDFAKLISKAKKKRN